MGYVLEDKVVIFRKTIMFWKVLGFRKVIPKKLPKSQSKKNGCHFFDSLSPKTHKNAYSSIPNMHFSNENLGKTVISFRKVVANLQFTNND